ncbi:U7 snRNA-associated Sm-like protein LSm11 [Patella vulgata]|uniref:U7 snRNA-associated Sm-like protein LSm11 n=1 Tax=Patella vulgata TaxID=6465 RepID=UPI0024A9CC51|nr:U7 snRNA-associated Sm-like protein LSm11 [Patella vulgata]
MAAPGKDESTDAKSKVSMHSVDVLSPDFDPLSALYSRDVVIPYPEVQVFSTLSEYEKKMTAKPKSTPENPQTSGSAGGTARMPKKAQFRQEGAAPKAMKSSSKEKKISRRPPDVNILTRMEKRELKGPLNVLQKCIQERHHVRVWTRNAVSIRGICRGYIVAFDKHFNMAMIDVDEVFKNPCIDKKKRKKIRDKEKQEIEKSSVADQPTRTDQKSGSKLAVKSDVVKNTTQNSILLCESVWLGLHPTELSYRHVNQIFIRGDNIACVNIIQR